MKNSLTIVIFGATGDLYQNKLSVALFELFKKNVLPSGFTVVGFARRPLGDIGFKDFTRESILKNAEKNKKEVNEEKLNTFLGRIKYVQGELSTIDDFKTLGMTLGAEDANQGYCSNKLFYLAVPPNLYEDIFHNIAGAGLTVPCAPGITGHDEETPWTRVLVEKPFGNDMVQAERLDKLLGELFDESQIFRIDHYLAKETLQNILTFRFTERTLEEKWNNTFVDRVEIKFHEANIVGKRGLFYDGLGALRDVGQNHMLQMLALVAMEDPKDGIHEARANVLSETKATEGHIMRGQYEGYLQEPNVKPGSDTETFFRIELEIDSARWKGVPFMLESGKALSESVVSIEVFFKDKTSHVFNVSSNAGVTYDAYEKVFSDCIVGDQTVFTDTQEVMAEWKIITKIINSWQSVPLGVYPQGALAKEI